MYARILVPIDGSAAGERGLAEAIALAKTLGSRLVLMHALEDFALMVELSSVQAYEETRQTLLANGRNLLARAADKAQAAGVPCETVMNETSTTRPAQTILDEVRLQRCDLIVMGTHGRRGFARLTLGSDSEFVVRESLVPVLLVRRPE